MEKLSVVIITLNEQKNIEQCIKSVQNVSNDIIIIDSLSSDNTREIATKLGAKVIEQSYLGDGPQKAFGIKYTKNDWVLSIDADERLTKESVNEINKLDLNNTPYDSFSFPRKTYIGKHFIKLWYPDRAVRLYNKNTCGFSPEIGHAKVIGIKNTYKLVEDMLHYSYDDYSHMIKTSHKFIVRGAKMSYESEKKANILDPISHGFGALFKALFLKGGAFHGIHGWNVAIISAFSSYMKYAIILEMQDNDSKDK